MNIIFLDIDGPLLPRKMFMFQQNRLTGKENPPLFDPVAVRMFNLWAKHGNAQVVFSTSWRLSYECRELKAIMEHNGLELEYHRDVITPYIDTDSRGRQICQWLDGRDDVERFIAVDDDFSCDDIPTHIVDDELDITAQGRWIKVDYDNGLTIQNFNDGLAALGVDMFDLEDKEFNNPRLSEEELNNLANSLV